MRLQRLTGVIGMFGISVCAMVVSADQCFDNETHNTCSMLAPAYPSGSDCVVPMSNNSCEIGVPACDGVDSIGSPTTSECRFKFGTKNEHGQCVQGSGSEQTGTVQCSPAVGQACGGGGGVE